MMKNSSESSRGIWKVVNYKEWMTGRSGPQDLPESPSSSLSRKAAFGAKQVK